MNKEKGMGWIIFALLAAVSAAVVTTISKFALKDVDSTAAFAVQSLMIILVSWGVVVFQGHFSEIRELPGKTWLYLLAAGVVTAGSSLLSFRALKLGEASQVSPVQQLSFVFAIIFAGIFLKEKITPQVIIGGLLMLGGAVLISFSSK